MAAFKRTAAVEKTSLTGTEKKTPRAKVAKEPTLVPLRKKRLRTVDAVLSRRTITIKRVTEQEVSALVRQGEFSAFVQIALEHELQRKRIDDWLAEQQAVRGGKPLSADALSFAESAWRSRK